VSRSTRSRIEGRAFTLLELLVATAIFALLIAALYAALFGGVRLRETAWKDFEAGVDRDQVGHILADDLNHIVVPAGILAGPLLGQTATNDRERADRLEFYSTTGAVTEKEPWGEIQKIEYFLEESTDDTDGEGYDFVRRVQRDLLATVVEQDDVPGPEWRLLSGVTALTIQYYDGLQWVDSWDTTTVENENPEGISLRLDLAPDADGRIRPPLEIVCESAQQPRPTASPSGGGGSGGTVPNPPQTEGGSGVTPSGTGGAP